MSTALPRPSGQRRLSRRVVVGLAVLAVVVTGLAWVAYVFLGTTLLAHRHYARGLAELRGSWLSSAGTAASGRSGSPPASGAGLAILRVPAFGPDFEVPVLAGVDAKVLRRGVGHYPGTAAPGQVGNCALAGLRVTHGQPFFHLRRLRRGDQVVVETRDVTYTYVIDVAPRDLTVSRAASWVLDPVPGERGGRPTKALITLTTSQDILRTPQRSVGFGHLASSTNKH